MKLRLFGNFRDIVSSHCVQIRDNWGNLTFKGTDKGLSYPPYKALSTAVFTS